MDHIEITLKKTWRVGNTFHTDMFSMAGNQCTIVGEYGPDHFTVRIDDYGLNPPPTAIIRRSALCSKSVTQK